MLTSRVRAGRWSWGAGPVPSKHHLYWGVQLRAVGRAGHCRLRHVTDGGEKGKWGCRVSVAAVGAHPNLLYWSPARHITPSLGECKFLASLLNTKCICSQGNNKFLTTSEMGKESITQFGRWLCVPSAFLRTRRCAER